MIPADKIAYLELGEENARQVGFGTSEAARVVLDR